MGHRKSPEEPARKDSGERMKEFTMQEVAAFDGRNGNPTYICVEGKLYDVSSSSLWVEGVHMDGHFAGNDLTGELDSAPHGKEVFEAFPQVGTLKPQS
jgi:predicted heme/steroid binding protein